MTIYRAVVGSESYRLMVLPEVAGHAFGTYANALRSFKQAVPEKELIVDPERVSPWQMWKRELAFRLPFLRARIAAGSHSTVLASASHGELIKTAWGLITSQLPGHDAENAQVPSFADTWFSHYDAGTDVTQWYRSTTQEQS